MMTVGVYTLDGPRNLVLKEEELNENTLSSNEIIAKTIYSAISPGTELAAFAGAPPLRPMKVYPRVVGYCNMAKVTHTGSAVSKVRSGDLILTFQSHRSSFKCNENDFILRFSESDPLKNLTLTYLYHLGYAALLSGNATPGCNIAIVGAGTLGFSTASLAKACSFQTVVFTGRNEMIGFLQENSIQSYSKSNAKESISKLHTEGFDIVINTSNSWVDWEMALQISRKGGIIVNLGFPGREDPIPPFNPLDSKYFYDKQLTIKSTGHVPDLEIDASEIRFTVKRNMAFLADLIRNGTLNPNSLISSEIDSKDLENEYQKMLERKGIYFTSLLKWY